MNGPTLNRLSKAAFGAEIPKYSYATKDNDLCAYNGWFAIIHADGNGLGKIVQEIGTDRKVFSDFFQKDWTTRHSRRHTTGIY